MLNISSIPPVPPVTANPGLSAEAGTNSAPSDAFADGETPIQAAEAVAGEDMTPTDMREYDLASNSTMIGHRQVKSNLECQIKSAVEEFHVLVAAFKKPLGKDWDVFYLRARHLNAAQKTEFLAAIAHPEGLLLNSRPPSDADPEKLRAVIEDLGPPQLRRIAQKFDAARPGETNTAKPRPPAGKSGQKQPMTRVFTPREKPLSANRVLWNNMLRPIIDNALTLCKESAASPQQQQQPQPQPKNGTILDKFYACAAYMSSDEKTRAIHDLMELSSGEWLPRPGKTDVEKFRSIAIDLNQHQRQSLRDWFGKVASFHSQSRRMQYLALLFQIFDEFPILELNTATKDAVTKTEGQTFFTPGLLEVLSKGVKRH
ncbi:hypothetical protein D9O50_04380 [Oxalobacteraceae bacterium CAVE-383]|nr:hypothetical protein D9O50_04380 [Oxalobacteraceae bacterium CAVE-383]